MRPGRLPESTVERLYRKSRADRWSVPVSAFADALERSALKAFAAAPSASALERFLESLHLEDLALAVACASGHPAAWEHFVREHRPALYRAADAIDPSGASRDLADSLYGELFGLNERDGQRRSHFDYFHGRSSLSTWLRAILSQRFVDRVRGARRFEQLPEPDASATPTAVTLPAQSVDRGYGSLMRRTLAVVVSALVPRDRLRLAYYYVQELTLAQIGRALNEHEATVSRNLARARREIRMEVERVLRESERMSEAEISECFASVLDDAGELDVTELLGRSDGHDDASDASTAGPGDQGRKETGRSRSKRRVEGASA